MKTDHTRARSVTTYAVMLRRESLQDARDRVARSGTAFVSGQCLQRGDFVRQYGARFVLLDSGTDNADATVRTFRLRFVETVAGNARAPLHSYLCSARASRSTRSCLSTRWNRLRVRDGDFFVVAS